MIQHFNEQNRRDLGIVWFIVGAVFLFSGLSGGVVFFLLGFIWLATSKGQGLELFRDRPNDMRAILQNATVALLILAVIILLFNVIP